MPANMEMIASGRASRATCKDLDPGLSVSIVILIQRDDHLGHQTRPLPGDAGAGPLTAQENAARFNCAARYFREWLTAQAAGGYLAYHASADPYELPPEQTMVLADEESPFYQPPAWNVPAAMWFDEEKALEAFRTGRGVACGEHDGRLACGVAAFYRNGYSANLVPQWLPALDGVVAQLETGIDVADVGCGHGHSTLLMAKAFPNSRFHGFDSYAASVEEARRNAATAAVTDRATTSFASSPPCTTSAIQWLPHAMQRKFWHPAAR